MPITDWLKATGSPIPDLSIMLATFLQRFFTKPLTKIPKYLWYGGVTDQYYEYYPSAFLLFCNLLLQNNMHYLIGILGERGEHIYPLLSPCYICLAPSSFEASGCPVPAL